MAGVAGIKLDFGDEKDQDKKDQVNISLYDQDNLKNNNQKPPKCYLDKDCEHFVAEELEYLNNVIGNYKIYRCYCSYIDKSVIDIFYEDKKCPLDKWYTIDKEDLELLHQEEEHREEINKEYYKTIEEYKNKTKNKLKNTNKKTNKKSNKKTKKNKK
jgi:hypothetical protein